METNEALSQIIEFAKGLCEVVEKSPPTEMSDDEFLEQYATLGKEWLPEWHEEDGCVRGVVIRHGAFMIKWATAHDWSSCAASPHIVAALLESYCQKKLREQKEPAYVANRRLGYIVERNGKVGFDWLRIDGEWVCLDDRTYFPTFRHALLAGARAK